jgi:hypothetical protein
MRPLALILCLLLPACGHLRQANEKSRAAARERELKKLNAAATSEADSRLGAKAAGEVVRVDATGEFVLIRARNGITLAPDQELECRGPGGGRIKVTPERMKSFFAADVMSGTPAVGDSVIPVKGGKLSPKLVPLAVQPGAAGDPANTIYLQPGDIRPEHFPDSTLGEPGSRPLPPMIDVPREDEGGASLLEEPPLPQKDQPLLPEAELPQ